MNGHSTRTAVIVGASSGIGEALAHELNRAGWRPGAVVAQPHSPYVKKGPENIPHVETVRKTRTARLTEQVVTKG